ncbi:MAG: hypothetical protein Q9217_003507 [Psora testacea]
MEAEQNMLHQLTLPPERINFLRYLLAHKSEIETSVARHLGLSSVEQCRLSPTEEWIHGSFNLCIPVYIEECGKRPGRRAIIRFPLPYKVGESDHPGNADEKLRCEAATYAWIQANCPDVPIPYLWGFALSSGQSVSDDELENEGVPTDIDRNTTYPSIEPYLLDLLAYHDNRLLHQPNSINDETDCREQMATLTRMRSVLHHFISRDLRYGPFLLTLTDIHQSNIFVDDDWHIKYLIDLEWACSLPIQMQHPPYWLTSRAVDDLIGKHLVTFNEMREEFMTAFESEERRLSSSNESTVPRTRIMKAGWDKGSFWYFHAVHSTVGLISLFWSHIWPKFACFPPDDETYDQAFSSYWSVDADKFVATKMRDRSVYNKQLREAFERKIEDPSIEDDETAR